MSKVKLTAGRIAGFQCDEGKSQAFLWCAEVPGLGVRATAGSSAKRYIFQAKVKGQSMRVTIGRVSAWSIEQAQAEAREIQILIDRGFDPRQVKLDAEAAEESAKLAKEKDAAALVSREARESVTLGEAWPVYLNAKQANPKTKWSARHLLDHQRVMALGGKPKARGQGQTVAGVLSPLSSARLCDLNGELISGWLNSPDIIRRPTQARRAFTLLRAFVSWCNSRAEFKAIIPDGACASHVAKDALPKPAAKDDCLQREQLTVWFDGVRTLNNPVVSAYLQTLLITGARREELAGLQWKDVDFKWQSLTIRDKVEGRRVIPLTPYVASLLLDLKRRNETPPNVRQLRKLDERGETWHASKWVFFSRTAESGRLAEPRIGHNRALALAGLPHITLHGLRRSFGTLCEWVEMPTGISAQIMGHKPSALAEKHYRRRSIDLLRMWHVKIEAWILTQAEINFVPEQAGLRIVAAK